MGTRCCEHGTPHVALRHLIGVSLSELHTNVTALCTCVCMYTCLLACLLALDRPFTLNERIQIFHEDRREACEASGGLPSECSIGDPKQRRLKLKHAWHLFVLQAVVDWVASRVEFQVGGPCINGTHKRQKFSS